MGIPYHPGSKATVYGMVKRNNDNIRCLLCNSTVAPKSIAKQTILVDRTSLVVKVTGSWTGCQEFEPSVAEDPRCRGAMHGKSV
ncbi:hypothetical protein TNCV_1993451 [Trichonephila clavipes]|nr:hypothetical protein TNCV_1993451 [Trichonephila clavipes]